MVSAARREPLKSEQRLSLHFPIRNMPRFCLYKPPRGVEIMACAQKGGDLFLLHRSIGKLGCERTNASFTGKSLGSPPFFLHNLLVRVLTFRLFNPGRPQAFLHPSGAVSPPGQRRSAHRSETRIIDIAKRRKSFDQSLNIRHFFLPPTPFAHFSRQIGSQFRTAGRITPGIMQRQLLQAFAI